jgi:hypothetical protein
MPSTIINPPHIRTEERAPEWGSEFTTLRYKSRYNTGGIKRSSPPRLNGSIVLLVVRGGAW